MATESKRIAVSELDFDQIKSNLKQYLRGQEQFSDYDFEGSSLSILLDVLALNTHYNNLYNNFAVNELFIDSATKRNSVVSRAKELGYIPHSATCAQAVVNMTVSNTASNGATLTLPKYSPFTTSINGTNYTFYTLSNYSATNNGSNVYTFENVVIKEGTPLTYKFTVASGARYIIPNVDVDMSTLTVRVQDSQNSSNYVTYNRSDSILTVGSNDKAYFIKEIDDQQYELTFGDGIIGAELSNGNIVHIEYVVTHKDLANGARVFSFGGTSLDSGTLSISTVTESFNGAEIESIDSIKFNAPKSYTTQNRAVTIDDYRTLIYNNFPEAQSVAVWGGESNNPPVYGKTYICVKPFNSEALTQAQKNHISTTIIDPRRIVGISSEFVDPQFLEIGLDITAYYNENETSRSLADIKSLIQEAVTNYDSVNLQKFEGIFRFSAFSRAIDNAEPSIINNITVPIIRRKVIPTFNTYAQYYLNLINPIYTEGVPEQAISSSGFYIQGSDRIHYLEDDGVGNIQLFYHSTSSNESTAVAVHVIVDPYIGTVDYSKGIIDIKNLNITSVLGDSLVLTIKPESSDIVSAYTQIARIDYTNLNINVIADKTATGNFAAGTNYVFTSSEK